VGRQGPKPFIQLWRLLHDRLTRVNVCTISSGSTGTANQDWYPGDDVVDIIGIDEYPADVRDPLSAEWDDVQVRFGGPQLVAPERMSVGVPDLATLGTSG